MNPVEDLAVQFKKTFDDRLLTKAERQELQIALTKAVLDQRKRDILRSKVFDIARTSMNTDAAYALEWLESASRLLEAKDENPPRGSSVYFSPGDHCLSAIVTQIEGARASLDICVFTISDDRISDALVSRKKRGLPIRIITDNEKLLDAGSDITRLSRSGIELRVDRTEYHMHHKFMIADRRVALTGSYNWTRSAAMYNEENIIVTEEAAVVRRFQEEFDRLWERTDRF